MTTRWIQHVAILAQVCFASFLLMQQFRRRWRRKGLVFAQWLLVGVTSGLVRVHTCVFEAVSAVFRWQQRLRTLVIEDIDPEEGLLV